MSAYDRAMRLRHKRRAERELIDGRLVHPNPYGGHGSLTAYTTCGCQCASCRGANAAYFRQYRARRTEGDIA